jgi:hypothetical protein
MKDGGRLTSHQGPGPTQLVASDSSDYDTSGQICCTCRGGSWGATRSNRKKKEEGELLNRYKITLFGLLKASASKKSLTVVEKYESTLNRML